MANLLHLKASRTKILSSLPTKSFGKDGDIVISMIKGKGVYLCTKVGGSWYTQTKMSPLAKLENTPINITASKIKLKSIKNSSQGNKFVVSEGNGDFLYRSPIQVLDDLDSDALSINYKTAYCSLGQYNDKETCESNGGTWYYSENDSHDSISNTAENELLTIGSSIGKINAESTLTYDGSTLEIKYNSDYDDNWQTSAQDTLLKLSYDSSNNVAMRVSTGGDLRIDPSGGDTILYASTLTIGTIAEVGSDTDKILMSDGGTVKYVTGANLRSYIGAGTSSFGGALNDLSDVTYSSGDLTISSLDKIISGALEFDCSADITFDVDGADVFFKDDGVQFAKLSNVANSGSLFLYSASDNNDYLNISCGNAGVTSFSTTSDPDDDTAHMTFTPNGDFRISSPTYVDISGCHLALDATEGIYFDGATGHTHIAESSDDVLAITVGNDLMLEISEASNLSKLQGRLSLKEVSAAASDTAAYGQIWVDDAAPNELAFTDDAGTDIVGIGKYHYETKFIAYNAGATGIYFPMNGYIIEGTTTSGRNEYQAFLAPYNGTIQKVAVRTEIAQDGDYSLRILESADGTEIPGTAIFRNETTVDIADDIYQELDMTSPGIGSDYSPLTKGRIYMVYLSHPSIPYDTNVIMVFKWDITS